MSPSNPKSQGSLPLGKKVAYTANYQPSLLYPIPRKEKRDELQISDTVPFKGADIWNAYELSWLNNNGLPQVAIGVFIFPVNSPNIIESKSLKLYLNSLNQTQFDSKQAVESCIGNDLSRHAGMGVEVQLVEVSTENSLSAWSGVCLDSLDLSIQEYDYNPELLKLDHSENADKTVIERLFSHLLKSNCLITNQPDWASIQICYQGAKIDHHSLLAYLVSFRTHNEFHEQCVERIYRDIMQRLKPLELTVYARYTRRGGLDINPWRSNCVDSMPNCRLSRQ